MRSPLRYILCALPLSLLTGCAASSPAPGATSDSKTWFLYVILMAMVYGGTVIVLVWGPMRLFFTLDWKTRSLQRKASTGLILGYFYIMLHMVAGLAYVSDVTNYMYSVQVANDGLHYRSWGRNYVVEWNDMHDARVMTARRGAVLLIVQSKGSEPLKIDSRAYWDWDGFVAKVQSQMSRHHESAKFYPLTKDSPPTDLSVL